MKFTNSSLIFLVLTSELLHSIVCATPNVMVEENRNYEMDDHYEGDHQDSSFDDPLTGATAGRSLLQRNRTLRLTCNKLPRICYFKGSPGPSCCKRKCVNLLKDRMNCGKCGKKCKYSESCCNGKCVNTSFNTRHCGGCNNSCNNGEFCVFGLCSYA